MCMSWLLSTKCSFEISPEIKRDGISGQAAAEPRNYIFCGSCMEPDIAVLAIPFLSLSLFSPPLSLCVCACMCVLLSHAFCFLWKLVTQSLRKLFSMASDYGPKSVRRSPFLWEAKSGGDGGLGGWGWDGVCNRKRPIVCAAWRVPRWTGVIAFCWVFFLVSSPIECTCHFL